MNATTYGLDLAKSIFQLYWVDAETGETHSRRLSHTQLIFFLSNRSPGKVVLEACGGAHWWARKIISLGHQAILLHPKYVRPFVRTNKTDAADARAIWTAAQQPGMRPIPVKTEAQQAILGLHRIRSELVDSRTRQVNQIRGLLGEYGLHFVLGRKAAMAQFVTRLSEIEQTIPAPLWRLLSRQLQRLRQLDAEILAAEQEIAAWLKTEPAAQCVDAIPGIGPITATALVATMGSPQAYRSGRAFAASLGLVPTQSGTGGKVHLGHISKRGDPYLRKLLIHGARIVLTRSKRRPCWAEALLVRRPINVAIVALANKMARTAWALLAHRRVYEPGYVSARPV